MKIDWKRKLTSRKFWAAVVGFVTSLMVGFGCTDSTITQAVSIIMAGAVVIAFIIGEGLVDAESVGLLDNDYTEETTTASTNCIGFVDTNSDEICEEDNSECP